MNAEELSIARPAFHPRWGDRRASVQDLRTPGNAAANGAAHADAGGMPFIPLLDDEDVLLDLARLRSGQYLRAADVLPRQPFLRELQREKVRSDRSNASLSVSLFRTDGDK